MPIRRTTTVGLLDLFLGKTKRLQYRAGKMVQAESETVEIFLLLRAGNQARARATGQQGDASMDAQSLQYLSRLGQQRGGEKDQTQRYVGSAQLGAQIGGPFRQSVLIKSPGPKACTGKPTATAGK